MRLGYAVVQVICEVQVHSLKFEFVERFKIGYLGTIMISRALVSSDWWKFIYHEWRHIDQPVTTQRHDVKLQFHIRKVHVPAGL